MTILALAASACVAMFSAQNAPLSHAIYMSGGTSASTVKLRDTDRVAYITPYKFGALFSGVHPSFGRELFRTAGTPASTWLLKDLWLGSNSSEPKTHRTATIGNAWDNAYRFATVRGRVVFRATNAAFGNALFASDGTKAGTIVLRNFKTAVGLRDVLAHTAQYALVIADDSIRGASLWATDGTRAGTRFLMRERGINESQKISAAAIGGNKIVFTQDKGNTLWVTDGTGAGTIRIREFPICALGSNDNHIKSMKGFPGRGFALFSGCTNFHGHELWRTDGTTTGTTLVRNIMRGPDSSEPAGFYAFKNDIVFAATSDTKGRELWTTQGTNATTRLVKDLWSGASSSSPIWFKRFGQRVVFAAKVSGSQFPRLYSSDLTVAGTRRIGDTIVDSQFANIGTKLVFGGRFASGSTGNELMGTRGLVGTTHRISDIWPGTPSSEPMGITAVRINQDGFATPEQCPPL
ncbi:MAG: hypothetical protein KKB37_10755 [Alphaproteobacteria bacterium]|nr:hypothetical protein [Alphaproteobacteria bacterium]